MASCLVGELHPPPNQRKELMKIDIENKQLFPQLLHFNLIGYLKRNGIMGGDRPTMKVGNDGKIRILMDAGRDVNSPWIHVNSDPNRNCKKQELIEKLFNFIPTVCIRCWKVVVRPKTVIELIQLHNLMEDMNVGKDVYCKCGIEIIRPFVTETYGGYFYTNSLEEGLARKEEVQALCDKYIRPGIKVILKRYCSEWELKYGNSKGYNQPKEAKIKEAMIDSSIELPVSTETQSDILKRDIIQRWIEHAHDRGDLSYKQLNNDEPLYSELQTY